MDMLLRWRGDVVGGWAVETMGGTAWSVAMGKKGILVGERGAVYHSACVSSKGDIIYAISSGGHWSPECYVGLYSIEKSVKTSKRNLLDTYQLVFSLRLPLSSKTTLCSRPLEAGGGSDCASAMRPWPKDVTTVY